MSEASPFFIIGSERSGTTLLMVMLGAHSRLAVPEVTWYYPRFRAFLHTYGDLAQKENFRTLLSEMIHGLKTPYSGLELNPRLIVDELAGETREATFAEAFRVILERFARDVGKARWGEKTPHNLYYVKEILEDFPNARFIHLNRDGRDVASEQIRSAFGPRNIYSAAVIWKETQEEAARARAAVPAAQWLDVKYETLVREPEHELRRVLDFLHEDYEAGTLDFHQGEIAQRRARTRDHRPLGEPVNDRHVGIYRRFLSRHDQGIFASVAGSHLKAARYDVEVEPVPVSSEEAALYDELDQRIRAATLDAPEGHVVYESYNDWLADRREARRLAGVWSGSPDFDWASQFRSGQRAPLHWKNRFAIPRVYSAKELVL